MLLAICMVVSVVYLLMPKFGSGPIGWKIASSQISTFATAIEMFKVDTGHYPKTLNDLVVQPSNARNWRQYMEEIPLDPWQHPYIYTKPGTHGPNSYDLSSIGPDGKLGTDDDINNWQSKNAK
jgi:general secretion pathway protein G